jgi:hypothetical protein
MQNSCREVTSRKIQSDSGSRKPFFSRTGWVLLITGLSAFPALLAIDTAFALFGAPTPREIGGSLPTLIGLGGVLTLVAPWFSSQPLFVRFILTFACGAAWLVSCLLTFLILVGLIGLPLEH